MNDPEHADIAEAAPDASPDCDARIVALRAAGADRFDPVRLRYIEALARRATAQQDGVRRVLDARLAQALAAYRERFERAQSDAGETAARAARQYPHAADELRQRLAAGDFKGLRRLVAALESRERCPSLGALVRELDQHSAETAGARPQENSGSRAELKAIRNFRNTWSKLSVDKQVAQALEQAPKNAGPINSHMLVLRSLALMRDISPDYLNRFMSYADALLSLDQPEKEKPGNPKKQQARAKKPGKSL